MAGFLKANQAARDNEIVFDVTSTVGDSTYGRYAEYAGTTAGEFFDNFLGGRDPDNYNISVNGEQVSADYVLQSNDDVVVVQSKIAAG